MLAVDLAAALDPVRVMEAAGFRPDPWQERVLRSPSPRQLLLCTRQAGKSTVAAALACHEAIYRSPSLVLLLSPSLRQSQELFRKVSGFFKSLPVAPAPEGDSSLRLELPNGSRIVSLPGTEQTIRGYSGVNLLVIDEAARVDDSLFFAVRPMLAVSHGRLVAMSTPWGRRGWFHQEWTGTGTWERIRITAEMCPRISKEFLDEERASLGERWFAQEYQCSFEENEAGVFRFEDIEAAIDDSITPLFEEVPS